MLKRWFCVVVILATSSLMVVSWPCHPNRPCHWKYSYRCVGEDEKGCPCRLTHTGPQCRSGQVRELICARSLGMAYEVRNISDEQINASSWLNEHFTPQQGRLNNPISAWCAHPLDSERNFKVTFDKTILFLGVTVQGDPMNGNNYPKRIAVYISKPGQNLNKVFHNSLSINGRKDFKHWVRFLTLLEGNLMTIVIDEYEGDYACMRVEIYGCHRKAEDVRSDVDCFQHLGIKDPAIFPDSSFSASSEDGGDKAHEARLDNEKKSWCPKDKDPEPTLNITLPDVNKFIFGIVAQGDAASGKHAKYLSLHKDGQTFVHQQDMNYDGVTTVMRFLRTRIPMRKIDDDKASGNKLEIKLRRNGTGDCMRIELIACDWNEPCYSSRCLNGGTCIRKKHDEFTCQCRSGFGGNTCETGRCAEVIQIQDVNVSSHFGNISYRLTDLESWCTTKTDKENWIQLTFSSVHHVIGFSLGGNTNTSTVSFVKKFKVFFKVYPWLEWTPITIKETGDVFNGTVKSGRDRADYFLDSSTRAFSMLFHILEYNDWEMKCARMELRGCHDSDFCDDYNPCLNGTCGLQEGKPFVCDCFPGFAGKFCERDLCDELNCHADAECVIGSNVTCKCNPGFRGDGHFCEDICLVSKCHHNATCGNETSYQCTCHEAFQGNGTFCEDRCVVANCHADATCNKTTGYACVCKYGYGGNGSECHDLCEVADCHQNATCNLRDDIKFANCSCDRGFVGNGTHCVDLCEKANCHDDATCFRNDDIKFANCSCNFGFGGDGSHCFDLCESASCHKNATCNLYDDIKFANCSCNYGFGGNGSHCFDLCESASCHKNATCNLYDDTKFANCTCNHGFKGNGSHCSDLCEEANCHENAVCAVLDDIKFANCSCGHGFAGNGTYCFDLCKEANCHENGHCILQDEKKFANCSCDEGYRGNGTFCTAFYDWSPWTTCQKECGVEFYERTRECVDPEASFCILTETKEERSCGLEPCAVHGNWTTWSDWGTCSVTCGSGIHERSRDCTNPEPLHGGDDCAGVGKEFRDCEVETLCPGAAGFGIWSNWSECSMTCNEGVQNRSRNCENKMSGCIGEKTQTKPCLLKYCPVNGSYTPWSNWTACSTSCGPGQQLRHRNCTEPKPAYGGADCQEPKTEVKECFLEVLCSGDFGFSLWSSWSSCTSTCGNGLQWRARECEMADPGSYFCSGEKNETDICNLRPCPISGGFTNWTDWSDCDSECGSGQQEKTRSCSNPAPQHGGEDCSGETRKLQDCVMPDCPGDVSYTPWSDWSVCSVSCGNGVQTKTRYCNTGDECEGPAQKTKECLQSPCPVNGGFTEWGDWSICTVTCGSGTIERRRECSNPKPAFNGSDCFGLTLEVKECTMPTICQGETGFTVWSLWSACNVGCSDGRTFRKRECLDPTLETCNGTYKQNNTCYAGPCPIHGGYSEWMSWSPCSGYCGSGLQSRKRTCSSPEPAFGGAGCSGSSDETQDCQHAKICSGESGYNEWSQWTLCTQTCGNSTQIRTRTCKEEAQPAECSDPSTQTKPCDKGQCPVHGNWSEWSAWTTCSSSCGSGSKLRHRTCNNPVPSYGGLSCFGNAKEYVDCAMPTICPGDDDFSQWGNWGECNVTCGGGKRQRSRYCTVVPAYPPSEDSFCTLPTEQYISCYEEPCVVNGNFTPWTDWSACTTSCGFGTRTRYRNCTNPPPMFGGSDCLGSLHQMKECENMPDCPDDTFFTSWANWAECSSDCEGVAYKTRTCQLDDSDQCISSTNVSMECNTEACPVDGTWSQWTSWSLCSKTCGHQEETRTRVCENQRNGGSYCSGHDIEIMPCNDYDYIPCPDPPPAQWSDWSWWTTCTKSCDGGYQKRFRECNDPPPADGWPSCAGVKNETQDCNTHSCPIHGNWSEWTSWTQCTLDCGGGTQVRGRACVNPRPQFGGEDCEGDTTELGNCNVDPCPVHGGFTPWSSWTFCNKPCGNGTSDRRRSCTKPTPMYGGRNCSGETLQWNECNTHPCAPVNVVLDVTFLDVSWQEYLSNVVSFKLDVKNLIQSVYSSFLPGVHFLSCNGGNANRVQCSINVNYQSLAGDELVLLQDKLLDPKTLLHSMTSANVISSPLQARSTSPSSTSINVEWDPLPSSAETPETSDLSGYIIFYKETTANTYNKIAVLSSLLTKILENLGKFTPYKIVVCPYSKNGNGVPSSPLQIRTLEDVPSSPPLIKNITSPTPRSLKLTWTEIDNRSWHGEPSGYCVTYHTTGSNQSDIQEISNPSQLSTILISLKPYTRYYVQVAAKTGAGCGARDSSSYVTLEDAPSGPPQNVLAESTGTESVGIVVKWDDVKPEEQNGIILGYKVTYWKDLIKRTVRVSDSNTHEVEIIGLEYLTNYKVEVSAYTSVGDGPKSSVINVTTDETTPAAGPEIVQAYNVSSEEIFLKWRRIPDLLHRGTLLGYRIFYRPSNTNRKEKMIEISDTQTLQYQLTDLFWWWWYEIRIAGYTRIGTGVTSNVTVRTDEEIPSRYPENIRGVALTTTSMLFEWQPILRGFAHGVILRYKLIVRVTDDLSNIIVNTTLPAYETSYYMEGLKKFTNYTMWVSAFNSKGEGPVYEPGHINSTGEDGPEVPPDNIRVSTLDHISEIKIEWERIPPEFHNGILRGYYVEYTATVLAGKVVASDKRVVHSKRIRGNRYSTIVKNLDPGSTYEFKVFGYTIKNGTKSNVTVGETCRCPKYLRSNWWVLPPYTNTSNPESPGGIFFMVAKQVLDLMCGTCPNGHGETEFCYEAGCDKNRRRRSTDNSYQKNSLKDVATNVDENVEISFPVQGNRFMTTYAGVFPYISVVDAPGSAYFTVKNVPSTAEVVVNASIACLPMVLLMTLFAWMAGIVIWALERKHNKEHFPDPFTKGVPEGFWWAYISMTTVGYGDRSPVTIPGRIFAIIWVLMGLVIISIVTGGIVTSITSVLVVQEDKLYGAQVGAIENSAEYSKAVRQNADVVGFKNMDEIINAMHNKEISGALIDMYAAATKKDSFDGGDIQLNRLVEYPTGYGFVLSGNMAKAAPLLREALATQKNKISEIVEGNTESIQLDRNEAEEAKEKSSGLFDPTSETFTKSFNVTVSLLSTAVVAGLIWHFGRYRRRIRKQKKQLEELKEQIPTLRIAEFLKSEGQATLGDFTALLKRKITDIKHRHVRERKKTPLFKAELNRLKSTSTMSFNQRRARVSPEVNTAMYDDEMTHGSSISIPKHAKRMKSPRVHPEGTFSEDSSIRSSSIELKKLVKR